VKLAEALKSEKGHGYNLRENDKLVDMVEAGILDPTLVLEQVVKNSTSVAGNALTADTLVIFEDREVS
jgi:chaperonin GroEL (HSP60 family)